MINRLLSEKLNFVLIRGTDRDDLRKAAIMLWQRNKVMLREANMRQRASEIVYVVVAESKVVGISTAAEKKIRLFNNNSMFEFRCFITPEYRAPGLDVKLSKVTFDYLENLYTDGKVNSIGIVATLENNLLKKEKMWRRAVWPVIDMVFAGYTSSGDQIRVRYFKGAKI